jgi:hypothetical protein
VARYSIILAFVALPSVALGAGPAGVLGSGGPAGEGDVLAAVICNKGTIFNALKVVRAYRDNEAFAFKHFEGKRLEISGRLVAVKRDLIVDEAGVVIFDGYVALITPDGKPPTQFGLEFRFSKAALTQNPALACQVAELFPSQFVTLRGTSMGAVKSPDSPYVGIIFSDAELVN